MCSTTNLLSISLSVPILLQIVALHRPTNSLAPINTTQSLFLIRIFNIKRLKLQSSFKLVIAMADIDRSSDDVSADSKEQPSEASKGEFSEEEEILITMVYNLVGERWSLIAGRIPGRTAEEIEKYWTSRYSTNES